MRRLILFLLILMVSCNEKKTKNDSVNTAPLFSEFIAALPKVTLPITIDCSIDEAKEIAQAEKLKNL